MVFNAVLFDMDGTLVNSDAVVERSWCAHYDVDYDTLITAAHGVPVEQTARRFLTGRFPTADDQGEAAITEAAARQLASEYDDTDGVVATDGARELIALLTERDVPWGIVTSADVRLTGIRLAAAGITPPAVIVTSDDVKLGKPDPEGYRLAGERLDINMISTLVVEDSVAGIAAGRAAGARVAALKGLDGDIRIKSLRDLIDLVVAGGR
jgi:sugar-phosphatase